MQDIVVAIRVLRKRPGASAVVVLTLALGIAVNATFFTFFTGMILHPLPFEEPERLVYLCESQPKLGKSRLATIASGSARIKSLSAATTLWGRSTST